MQPSPSPPSIPSGGPGEWSAAALCHDLDNVLLSIDSHARALRAAGAATICDGADRHLDAIESGLEFLRRRSLRVRESVRRGRSASASLRLDDWWRNVDRLARAALPPRISLHASFSPSLAPVSIEADELTACLLHLMVNAGQAIPPPRVDGRISVAGRACRGGMVLVRVVDNGIGMSPGTIRRAGVPGFTTRADGTGMGLRAVRDAIAKIGGALTIDSTPGQGTKVDLRLPAASDYGSLSA
ncbi:MAG: hypothetical protein RL689_2399 [Planctomycetota bacterium]|jgi:signal transduction histidine kinase